MKTLVPSLIRTYVPVAVGALISWLLTLGVEVGADAKAGLIAGGTGVLIAAYYTLVRLAEQKWPWVSVLLGSSKQPEVYRKSKAKR